MCAATVLSTPRVNLLYILCIFNLPIINYYYYYHWYYLPMDVRSVVIVNITHAHMRMFHSIYGLGIYVIFRIHGAVCMSRRQIGFVVFAICICSLRLSHIYNAWVCVYYIHIYLSGILYEYIFRHEARKRVAIQITMIITYILHSRVYHWDQLDSIVLVHIHIHALRMGICLLTHIHVCMLNASCSLCRIYPSVSK